LGNIGYIPLHENVDTFCSYGSCSGFVYLPGSVSKPGLLVFTRLPVGRQGRQAVGRQAFGTCRVSKHQRGQVLLTLIFYLYIFKKH
jgi:hypothetical protein